MRIPALCSLFARMTLAAGLLLLLPPETRSEFYKYKDSNGTMVITNRLEDVPPQYRNQFKVVWDKDLEAKDPLARRQAAAREQREQQERQQASRNPQQRQAENKPPQKGRKLVVEMDETTGEIKRRYE